MMLLDIHTSTFELYGSNYYEVLIVICWFVFMGLILTTIVDLTRIIKTRYLSMLIVGVTAITNSYLHYESKKRTTCTYVSSVENSKSDLFLCHHAGKKGGTNHECLRETTTYFHLMRRVISSECHD
ncbi:MAG: hypothetical protein JKY53_06620 [Flavobacteriales bacterium]|nr:hypothetical protein [Flavobacteriales bacterium]